MNTFYLAAAVAAAIFAVALPARAAIELSPGEWQVTETGTENGQPVAPQVEKECMTADEARDAVNVVNEMKKQIAEQGGAQCQNVDAKQTGNTVTFVMKCGDPKQFSFDITGVYTFVSATRYTGTLKSDVRVMGQRTTSDKKIEAVRVGECPAGKGKK
ncbi:MAG: DUF3617 domain-containing protein [Xanthobacteraceae bacterium]|uniref:DUF3617 domain-containing protein n=1 Tax=Pseudolabrys sp. TaxID=1960880 RepID=UPI003D114C58